MASLLRSQSGPEDPQQLGRLGDDADGEIIGAVKDRPLTLVRETGDGGLPARVVASSGMGASGRGLSGLADTRGPSRIVPDP